ncbi:MAG: hypothetical protein CL785_04950 [Chloroflexi bacterium]|nr:hypothetical protein [Chloroflexota bacterium]|tara:strand:+ start:4270 stop:5208 length:939 start_codon:yes stop_codon:yes gene_type:complete
MSKRPSEEEISNYVNTLSNWGRWGNEDELGTINHITQEKVKEAISLVETGLTISCSRDIIAGVAADVTSPPLHIMTGSGEVFALPEETPLPMQGASDFIGMVFHGYAVTHVDALSHIFSKGKMYNNRSSALVTTRQGATKESIELLKNGVVTRGVLIDIPRFRKVNWLERGDGILPEELDAALKDQNTSVEPGDVLFVRTGHLKRRNEEGPKPIPEGLPGLDASCLPWIHSHGVAMLSGEPISDVMPSGYSIHQPIHQIGIPHMGLWLIDNVNMEELSETCKEYNRWHFMLSIAPLRIQYGTGSPVNPIAIF